MPEPLTDGDMGRLLRELGFENVSGSGPTAIWKAKRNSAGGLKINKGETETQRIIANLAFGVDSPYYVPTSAAARDTQNVGGRVMQFNPQSGRFDIDIGPVKGDTTPPAARDSRTDLPAGYFYRDGFVWRQVGDTLRHATNEELDAINAPPVPAPRQFAPPPPVHDAFTDVQGNRVYTTNGVVTSTIPGAEYKQFTPQQKLDAAIAAAKAGEDAALARQTAADIAAGQRSAAGDVAAGQRAAAELAERATLARTAGFEAAGLGRAELAEAARRANLQSATSAFGDVTRVAPQLGQLALANAGFMRDLLSTSRDYLARAFFQQGQTSPLPQVSTADIINNLRSNIAGFNSTLQGFNPQVGGFVPPPAYVPPPGFAPSGPPDAPTAAPVTAPAPAIPAPIAGVPGGGPDYIGGGNPAAVAAANAAFAPGGAFGFAHGGFTTEPVLRVGEESSGAPNNTEETILNPTRAPLGVAPNPQTAQQSAAVDPEAKRIQQRRDSVLKVVQFIDDPTLQHALVDEAAHYSRPQQAAAQGGTPRYAHGTGLFGFDVPQLPEPGAVTQSQIQALERRVRPPALNTLFAGGTPNEPRFGFNLFTPMQLGALTPDDRAALGTTLATQFNETLPNVEAAIANRFSVGRRGRSAAVGF